MTTPVSSPVGGSVGAAASGVAISNTTSMESQIRSIAQMLSVPPPVSSVDIKGVVTAVNPTASPPNLSLTLSGDTTVITGVVFLGSYSPNVGDTVLCAKQGASIYVLGQLADGSSGAANGWVTPTLGSGFTGNGNSNGAVQYRMVFDNGERKMQWRGGLATSGSPTAVCTVGATWIPSVKRSLITAREIFSGSCVIGIDFLTDGTVVIVGPNVANLGGGNTGTGSVSISCGSGNGGGTGGAGDNGSIDSRGDVGTSSSLSAPNNHGHTAFTTHNHGYSGGNHSHSEGSHTHGMSGGNHDHTTSAPIVNYPAWISMNGLEYFL